MNEVAEGVFEFGDSSADAFNPVVSMRQLKHALLDADLIGAVEAAINALDEPARSKALIDWESSGDVLRNHPMVEQIRLATDKTPEEVDAIFAEAALVI